MRRFSQISFGRRSSQPEPSHAPVLSAEDEAYFQRLTSQSEPGAPVPLPNDQIFATSPVGDDAKNAPLPPSPREGTGEGVDKENVGPNETLQDQTKAPELSAKEVGTGKEKKRRPWSRLWRMGSVIHKVGLYLLLLFRCTLTLPMDRTEIRQRLIIPPPKLANPPILVASRIMKLNKNRRTSLISWNGLIWPRITIMCSP